MRTPFKHGILVVPLENLPPTISMYSNVLFTMDVGGVIGRMRNIVTLDKQILIYRWVFLLDVTKGPNCTHLTVFVSEANKPMAEICVQYHINGVKYTAIIAENIG